jgi:DHA2 family multidrug resistance protein
VQSSLQAYIDVFWTLMLIWVAAVPLALVLCTTKLGAGAPTATIEDATSVVAAYADG